MIGCIRVGNKGDNEGESKTTGFEKECGINDDGGKNTLEMRVTELIREPKKEEDVSALSEVANLAMGGKENLS